MTDASSEALRTRVQELFGADLAIDRELGRGGMAAVFAAHDPALQRRVAVKVLLPELADDQAIADRFLREGRTMASLDHPNVVTVYAVRGDRGINAIVMQYVDGRSLDHVLEGRRDLPLATAGRILTQVALGLQHAHDRGVVHRDVKPANVLVDPDGRALVSDFGIARRNDGFDVTKTGMVLGTSDYMSPEQRSGERVTPATDQYAMGVMAYEVLCGRPPFVGATIDVIRGHMLDTPPSMRTLRPDIPESVDAVVARMLAKAPVDRWPSMQPILEAFASLEREPPRAETVEAEAPVSTMATRGASSSRWIIAAAAVVVVGAVGVWATRHDASPSAASLRDAVRRPTDDTSVFAAAPNAVPKAAPSATPSVPTVRGDTAMRAVDAGARAAASDTRVAPRSDSAASTAPAPVVASPARPVASPVETPPVTPAASPAPSPSASTPSASLNDARALGRQLVTLLNQRRTRELTALSAMGGEANARAELLRLADRADDFAVGFDRLPSAPSPSSSGFESDCYLDVEWRGGHKIFHLTFYATRADNGWHVVGFGVDVPSL